MVRSFVIPANDLHLRQLAADFCDKQISAPVDLDFGVVTLACEVDAHGFPVKAVGISQKAVTIDFPLWHFISEEAGESLVERNRANLEDSGLPRGLEVFLHIAKHDDKRCPKWKDFIRRTGAKKSNRWSVAL